MSEKITGIARIKVDGALIESMPGAEIDLGGVEREARTGHRVYGFTEKIMPGSLTCTIVHKASTPLEALRTLTEGLILFETDTGITWKMSNAFCSKTVKVKDESGEVTLEFQGDAAKEQ